MALTDEEYRYAWPTDPSDPLINTVVLILETDHPYNASRHGTLAKVITHIPKDFNDWRYLVRPLDYQDEVYLCYPQKLVPADRLNNRSLIACLRR